MSRHLIASLGISILAASLFSSCQKPDLTPREGFIDVPGGKVWYRITGTGSRTPLLILHGGPGVPSYYLKPLAALGDDRPVVFYDQLGCGHSDHPTDTTLWTIDRFIKELVTVRQALGLNEVHILGQSWGTMLAVDYMLTKPSGVKSLVLASPALSIPRWVRDADSLKSTLPESTRSAISRHEADGTYDSPEYQSAILEYYHRFVCLRNPWPADVESTLAQIGQSVYLTMCGPSEFTLTGSLKTYDRTDRLHDIKVPTLFTAGRYDEATPATVQYYSSLMPGSKLEIFENSAHITMEDEPERYNQVVRDFLREVDSR